MIEEIAAKNNRTVADFSRLAILEAIKKSAGK
mgnify:CR=1 FL=1